MTRDGAFEVEFEFETATSLSRASTASGDHHGLDVLSVWYVSGLEAQTSTVEAAESRGSHMTHNGEFEFEFEFETLT